MIGTVVRRTVTVAVVRWALNLNRPARPNQGSCRPIFLPVRLTRLANVRWRHPSWAQIVEHRLREAASAC